MAAPVSKPRHIPHFRRSPDAPLPKYKALVIGINYAWSPDGCGLDNSDHESRLQLKNPIYDAKAIKNTLKGAVVRLR